jgi:hypothetical protein
MNGETIKNILSYAIRAPSTHNSQPWLFKLKTSGVDVFYDEKYLLPQADPTTRDMYISIGCMLENMSIASQNLNYLSEINYGPFGEKTKIAEVYFRPISQISDLDKELFNIIPKRVNARGKFLNEKISDDLVKNIDSIIKNDDSIEVDFISSKEKIEKIALITQEAMHIAYNNISFRKEMSKWLNSNFSRKKEGLPGYSLKMPLLVSIFIPIIVRFFNIGKFLGYLNFKSISTAPLVIIFSSPDDNLSWLRVGRLAERTMLYVQSNGYQSSIYVGSIEMGNLYKEVQSITERKNRPQFILLVGKIPGYHIVTPRHDLNKKII